MSTDTTIDLGWMVRKTASCSAKIVDSVVGASSAWQSHLTALYHLRWRKRHMAQDYGAVCRARQGEYRLEDMISLHCRW